MAANIDTTTGQAAVMVTGQPAWHRLGAVVSNAQNSEEARKLSLTDWLVSKEKLYISDGPNILGSDHKYSQVPNQYAIVRQDTKAVLGIVGRVYQPYQNHELTDLIDGLVNEKLAMYETAGSLDGGRRIWYMARIPKEYHVKGNDTLLPYTLGTLAHDGSSPVSFLPTSVRVVCQNTLNLAIRSADSGIRVRHSTKMIDKIEAAKESLGIVIQKLDQFHEHAELLANRNMSSGEVKNYFREVFKMKKEKTQAVNETGLLDSILDRQADSQGLMQELIVEHKELTARQERNNENLLEQLFMNFEDKTNTLPGIGGSAWAAYNAVSEYVDHQQRTRGKDDNERDNNKLQSIWFGQGNTLKQSAFSQALKLLA